MGTEIGESPFGKVKELCKFRSSFLCLVKLQNQRTPCHNSCTIVQHELQASNITETKLFTALDDTL